MPAQRKEVVLDADALDPQYLGPDAGQGGTRRETPNLNG
jgi:hypothetical protein